MPAAASAQERVVLARLEAARQVYNACLGEAKRRVELVRQSKAFQRARTLQPDDPTRRPMFAQARAASACSEYGLHAYADQLRQSWLGDHLDSNTCQKLATRAYAAANRLLLGTARRVRGVWQAPAGHGGRQNQYERPPLARDPGRMERASAA